MENLNKILVVQTASIGDVILTTSILEKLHETYPEAQIDVLLKKGNEPLFYKHPFITNVFVWNKKEKKYRNLLDLINVIRDQKYDILFNVQRFFTSGFLTVLSGARKKSRVQ